MHLCVVQEERIELLDKLEQFPLKIRVKEEQESILRLAACCTFSALTAFVPMSVDVVRRCISSWAPFAQMYLHLCLSADSRPPVWHSWDAHRVAALPC